MTDLPIIENQYPVKYDKALSFDGTNDYVDCGTGASLNINNNFTICAWIKIGTAKTQGVVHWGEASNGKRRSILIYNGGAGTNYYAWFSGFGTAANIQGTTILAVNTWYFLSVTLDSSNVAKIYVNGNLDATGNPTLIAYSYLGTVIGNTRSAEWFNGIIDNVRIYNTALSQTQIQEVMNENAPSSGLVGEWLFNEESGSTAIDTSGSSNTGTIYGATRLPVELIKLSSIPSIDVDRETFIEIMKVQDIEPIIRLRLKRRYVVAGVNNYDADWNDITEYLTIDGCGDLSAGIDENEYISGTVKSDYVSLIFDNNTRKFTKRDNIESLWYDASTTYYINESKVELTFGYKMGDKEYYRDYAHFTGKIVGDNIRYDVNTNNVTIGVRSLIEDLKKVTVNEALPLAMQTTGDYLSISDAIFRTLNQDEYNVIANSPRINIMLDNSSTDTGSVYDMINKITSDTGSIFGVKRNGDIYITYEGNPYYTTDTGIPTSGSYYYFNFNENTTTSSIYDVISGGATYMSVDASIRNTITSGMDGSGRKFLINRLSSTAVVRWQLPVKSRWHHEVLFKISDYTPTPDVIFYHPSGILTTTSNCYYKSATSVFVGNPYGVGGGGGLAAYTGYDLYSKVVSSLFSYDPIGVSGDTYRDGIANAYNIGLCPVADYYTKVSKAKFSNNYSIREGTWNHMIFDCNVFDTSTFKTYLNGNLIGTGGGLISTGFTGFMVFRGVNGSDLGIGNSACDIEYDTLKSVLTTVVSEYIPTTVARIFKNSFQWQSTPVYSFYNYGKNNNIYAINTYEDGISKLYNKVVVSNYEQNKYTRYTCSFNFYFPSATSAGLYTYVGILKDDAVDNNTLYGFRTHNELLSILNNEERFTEVSMNNSTGAVVINSAMTDLEACNTSIGFFSLAHYNSATTVFSLTCSNERNLGISTFSKYVASLSSTHYTQYVVFNKYRNQSELNYVNTLSTYEYGEKIYNLDASKYPQNALENIENIATAFLTDKSQPKERLRIKTRFLEGDLELFDRVTLNWRPDTDSPNVYDDTDYDDDAPTEVGNITWTSKDFWVTGYRHSWRANETEYSLCEV